MRSRTFAATLCAVGLAAGGQAAGAGGNAETGAAKALTCLGCHGIPGYSNVYPTYKVPRLGGQHPEYIVAALKAYRDGLRKHPTMQAQARSLSEEDMADIAAFFASSS